MVIGYYKPIYKNKSSREDPNSYRGITLLSHFGKLFTSILIDRIKCFVESNRIIGFEQTGFRDGYSTIDNLFTLYGITDIVLFRKHRLYCAFLDYEKAFDKANRACLWQKLFNNNISGKILSVLKNIYLKAKSCICVNNNFSECFDIDIGVIKVKTFHQFYLLCI